MKTSIPAFCVVTSFVILLGTLAILLAGGLSSANASVYSEIVVPILDARCVQCHGEEKDKGDLRLDSFEAIMKGGSEGEDTNVVAGDPKKSYLIERLHYPIDDDERMPPEDEKQLTKNEVALLEWWVTTGAKKDLAIAAAKPSKELAAVIADFKKNIPKAGKVAKVKEPTAAEKKAMEEQAKATAAVMAKINATGASLMPISAESDSELRFTALNVAKEFGDAQLAALKPIAGQILWLDLAGTKVTDKGLAGVAGMKNLRRLYLQNTAVTDAGLGQVAKLANLEYLNLYNSKVSDAGIAKLGALKNLKTVYLWQTKVTPKGAAALEKKLDGLKVNVGWTASDNAAVVAKADPPKPAADAKPAAKPAPKKPVAAKGKAKAKAKGKAKAVAPKKPAALAKAKEIADAEASLAKAKKAATDAQKKVDALKKK